jgi:hypothetical protein
MSRAREPIRGTFWASPFPSHTPHHTQDLNSLTRHLVPKPCYPGPKVLARRMSFPRCLLARPPRARTCSLCVLCLATTEHHTVLAHNAFLELTHCSARMCSFSGVRAQDSLPRQGQWHVQGVESAIGWFLGATSIALSLVSIARCLLPGAGILPLACVASLLTCTSLPLFSFLLLSSLALLSHVRTTRQPALAPPAAYPVLLRLYPGSQVFHLSNICPRCLWIAALYRHSTDWGGCVAPALIPLCSEPLCAIGAWPTFVSCLPCLLSPV